MNSILLERFKYNRYKHSKLYCNFIRSNAKGKKINKTIPQIKNLQKYYTVGTKSNRKIVELPAHLGHIYMTANLPGLVQALQFRKGGGVKLGLINSGEYIYLQLYLGKSFIQIH